MSGRTPASLLVASLGAAAIAALCFAGPAFADEPSQASGSGASASPGGTTYEVPVGKTHQVAVKDPEKEAEYRAAWAEYGKSVLNRYGVGFNALLTFPADPIMETVQPRAEFEKLPLGFATQYLAGLGTGVLLSAYRATMGAFDVVFAPVTPMKEMSAEPRWMIFPGVEHEAF